MADSLTSFLYKSRGLLGFGHGAISSFFIEPVPVSGYPSVQGIPPFGGEQPDKGDQCRRGFSKFQYLQYRVRFCQKTILFEQYNRTVFWNGNTTPVNFHQGFVGLKTRKFQNFFMISAYEPPDKSITHQALTVVQDDGVVFWCIR